MKIAILGTGFVGGTLGTRWAKAGHEVVFGSREPKGTKAQELIAEGGPQVRATSLAEAAQGAEVVVLAIPWLTAREILESLGDLSGKVLIDCINPLNATFTDLDLGYTTSAAEQIAGWVPAAHVVKAFNTVSAATMAQPLFDDQKATLFYCGDAAAAKSVVDGLAAELGFEPVDAGPLQIARYLEPLAMLYIHLAINEGWGSNCALKMMKREQVAQEQVAQEKIFKLPWARMARFGK